MRVQNYRTEKAGVADESRMLAGLGNARVGGGGRVLAVGGNAKAAGKPGGPH